MHRPDPGADQNCGSSTDHDVDESVPSQVEIRLTFCKTEIWDEQNGRKSDATEMFTLASNRATNRATHVATPRPGKEANKTLYDMGTEQAVARTTRPYAFLLAMTTHFMGTISADKIMNLNLHLQHNP